MIEVTFYEDERIVAVDVESGEQITDAAELYRLAQVLKRFAYQNEEMERKNERTIQAN